MPQANNASLSIVADGADTVLKIVTTAVGPSAVGSYVGGGTGNKGIGGLTGFSGLKLTDLDGLELDIKVVLGPTFFYMNFIVDLDCNFNEDVNAVDITSLRSTRRLVIWNPPTTSLPASNGYSRFVGTPQSSQWNIVGLPLLGMAQNNTPSGPIPAGGLTGFPNACIVDGVSADGGLPRNTGIAACNTGAALAGTALANCGASTAGALVLLGDSNNLVAREMNVRRVRVQNRLVTFN